MLLHKITLSIYYDIDELQTMKISNKDKSLALMNNFSFEFTPNESSAGGTLLYVANHLSYKPRLDLNIYKSNELESTFIEILNPKKSNIIISCIYKHSSMDLNDFNTNYLSNLLDKVSREQKSTRRL